MSINHQQREALLRGPNQARIKQRSQAGRTFSYLEQADVRAHLIRIFGFGGFDIETIACDLAFEEKDDRGRWHVGYKAQVRLRIRDLGATYTEFAVGASTLPDRGQAHDMASKTAESDAMKRAAVNLGSAFGLSLYFDGSLRDVVGLTLDHDDLPDVDFTRETENDDA